MLLGRLSEVNYSPMDLKFCFYIEILSFSFFFFASGMERRKNIFMRNSHWEKLFVLLNFCFVSRVCVLALGRKSLAESFIGARLNNGCRNGSEVSRRRVGARRTSAFLRRRRGQCGVDVVWIWIMGSRLARDFYVILIFHSFTSFRSRENPKGDTAGLNRQLKGVAGNLFANRDVARNEI